MYLFSLVDNVITDLLMDSYVENRPIGTKIRGPFGKLCGHLLGKSCSCSVCILTICNFIYFPFWFWGLYLGSGCFSSVSLHVFYFLQ